MMGLAADILLIAGAFGAGLYCIVLARRLNRFNDLEKGVGGAIAVLSAQVDDMTKTLDAARQSAGETTGSLNEITGRAEGVAQRLELLVASMHDLPSYGESGPAAQPEDPVEAGDEPTLQEPEQPDAEASDPGPAAPEPEAEEDTGDGIEGDPETEEQQDDILQAAFQTVRNKGEAA